MPLRAWIKPDLRDVIDDYVPSSQGLANRGLFDDDVLRGIVKADRNGQVDNAQRIWQFATFEQWLRSKGIECYGKENHWLFYALLWEPFARRIT